MQDLAVNVFVLSAMLVAYTIVGYPIMLALAVAIRHRRDELRHWTPRSVTILLAVHNGEDWIARKINSLLALDYPASRLHILVLDDGSTDETRRIVSRVTDPRIELVTLPRGGKARALNAGLAIARGEILLFTDVRQSLHPQSLRRLVERFADPTVGVVSGELVIQAADQEQRSVGLYWRYEKWIRRLQGRIGSMTGATGCLYAMRRELAVTMPPGMLVDDMYLPLSAFLRGSRIVFESAATAFDHGTTPGEEFHRKVRTLAGNLQVLRALPRLLVPSNSMWLHFLSHKIARLLLPYALLAVGFSSVFLPAPMRAATLTAQGVCYALALTDLLIPPSWLIKRYSSIARTFVVLMAAAFWAPLASLRNGATLWRPAATRVPLPGSAPIEQPDAGWRHATAAVR